MKSRISSCKRTAFDKNLGRFWPVWVGYILLLVLCQMLILGDDMQYWYAAHLAELISVMGVVTCGYGLVVAQMLFSDLFNTRLCSGLHSLPLRREHWFSVHIRTGMLFSLLPTALTAGASEWLIVNYSTMVDSWQIPLYWFAASNLQFLFFFGLAVFSAMCAGSRLAMTVIYGILNFFSILVYLLVDQLYTPLLQGVTTMSGPFELLCPAWQITNYRFLQTDRMETGRIFTYGFGIEEKEYIGTFDLVPEGWVYVGILALLGIVLLLLARQMYKKRHLECAGDFLAERWLEAPFQVVFTVLCAAVFHGVFMVFFGINSDYAYLLPAVGLIVGWFAGRMLLERSTQVFRIKNILGFVLIAAVMTLSLYATYLDPMGIETWIPKVGETKSATLRMNYRNGYTTEVPAEIADLTRLHELALQQNVEVHPDYDDTFFNPRSSDPEAAQIILQYENEYGWLSQRNYYILAEGESGDLMRKYCSRLDVLLPWADVEDAEDLRHELKDTKTLVVNGIRVAEAYITDDFRNALADAIAADAEAGCLVQSGAFHKELVVDVTNDMYDQYYLMLDIQGSEFWGSLYIYADCENILRVLEPTGVLEAVRQDCENAYG